MDAPHGRNSMMPEAHGQGKGRCEGPSGRLSGLAYVRGTERWQMKKNQHKKNQHCPMSLC